MTVDDEKKDRKPEDDAEIIELDDYRGHEGEPPCACWLDDSDGTVVVCGHLVTCPCLTEGGGQ